MSRKGDILSAILISGVACGLALAEPEPVRRGIVGLTVRNPAGSDTSGAEIVRLEISSPAHLADLRPGDIITHLNGARLNGAAQLASALQRPRAGSRWALQVLRGEKSLHFNLVAAAVKMEQDTAEVALQYTWVQTDDDVPLRVLITSPKKVSPPHPTVLLFPGLGGLPCDDPDYIMHRALALEFARHGYAMVRWDQRGAGDSYGDAYADVDFDSEVRDAAAVLRWLLSQQQVDRRRLYGFGYSMGGVVACQVMGRQDGLAGLITYGTLSRPLVEYMIDVARRQGQLAGLQAPELNRQVRLTIRFYERLLSGQEPAEILKAYPPLRAFATPGGYVQGKTPAFWRQLDSTRYAQLYGHSTVPVLALYGEHDCIATLADQSNIVALARAAGRQDVHSVVVPGTDHAMNTVLSPADSFAKLQSREYRFNPVAVDATVKWIRKLEDFRAGQHR